MKSNNNDLPLVSVVIPTYNRPDGLRRTLECITRQTYKNLEIIVSDNASETDEVEVIAKEYIEKDPRVQYFKQEINKGAAVNFQFVLDKATGDYFMWAADDDEWDLSYIRSCLEAFKKSRDIILVGTMCKVVNSETGDFYMIDEGFTTVGLRPRERFVKYKSVIHSGKHIGAIFHGLYKRASLNSVMPLRNVIACDHIMMADLCFQGEILTVQEPLMVKRYGGASVSIENIAIVLGITNRFVIMFPYLKREILLQKIIFQTKKFTLIDKIKLSIWSFCNYLLLELKLTRNKILTILPTWIKQAIKCFCATWQQAF